jgi:hypothetical protein
MKYSPERIPGDGKGWLKVNVELMVDLIEKAYQNDPRRIEVTWGEPDEDGMYTPQFKQTGRV